VLPNGVFVVCCSVNDNRCNSSSVLKVLLDPFVPVTRTLPLVVEAIFGGRPRFGVPKLGVRLEVFGAAHFCCAV
jgi:hypothetical protein